VVAAVGGWRTAAMRGLSLHFDTFQLEAGGGDMLRVYSGVVEEVPGEVASRTVWTLMDTFTGQTLPYTVLTHRTCDCLSSLTVPHSRLVFLLGGEMLGRGSGCALDSNGACALPALDSVRSR
jgi:hypothetical protein